MQQELIILNNILYLLGGISGLLFLYFRMRDSFQKDSDREATKHWYRNVWETIDRLKMNELPIRTIKWVINLKQRLAKLHEKFSKNIAFYFFPENSNRGFNMLVVLHLITVGILFYESSFEIGTIVLLACSPIIYIIFNVLLSEIISLKILDDNVEVIISIFLLILLYFNLSFLVKQDLLISTLFFMLLVPIFTVIIQLVALSFYSITDKYFKFKYNYRGGIFSFGLASSLSFSITTAALLIGNSILPQVTFSQNLQLLIANVFFDGLTLILTYSILKWSIKKSSPFRITIAIIVDVFVAALFACLSLYLGLLNSNYHLPIVETINILFAKSHDGSVWELGPYFWAMHSTFIPTLIYLMFICLTIIGKSITLPIMRFFKGVSGVEKPYYAAATTFGFVGGILLFIAKTIELYYA